MLAPSSEKKKVLLAIAKSEAADTSLVIEYCRYAVG